MASLVLSAVGFAIAGPIGGMIGGAVGGMVDNVLFPASYPSPPAITSSSYGQAIPVAFGPNATCGANMIWSPARNGKTGWRKVKGKAAKQASKKGAPPSYETDAAFLCGAGEWEASWLRKLIANGSVMFDASLAAHEPTPDANGVVTWLAGNGKCLKNCDSIVVYPGNRTQTPDPTIEADLGVGTTPRYIRSAYFVINGLKGAPYGDSIPSLQAIIRPHTVISLAQVVSDIATRCGVNPNDMSTSSLTNTIRGYVIDSQQDGVTALAPLALCYDFDIAEVAGSLRFAPRGQRPLCTIENAALMAHEPAAPRVSFEWPREAEMVMPKVAALTFLDPSRDCQENTQSARRNTGSMQSKLATNVKVVLSTDEGRKIADRMLWEANTGRQALKATTDDRHGFIEASRTYAIEVPFGYETVRVTQRSRGANSIISFEGKRDQPAIYGSAAPGASADVTGVLEGLGGPINPPYFVEPPKGFPGVSSATILICLSGGDGTTASDEWGGCNVYWASSDVTADYQLAGTQFGPTCMGKLAANLASYGGSNPDTSHTLSVDTSMSNGEPTSQTATDAQAAQIVYLVGNEFMSIETVTATGGDSYNLGHLWRGLYGTSKGSHSTGDHFARLDGGAFAFRVPQSYVNGSPLYFRFPSAGEDLASVPTYTFTPNGTYWGTGVNGAPSAPPNPLSWSAISGSLQYVFAPASPLDNVTKYNVYEATGASQPFSAATLVASGVPETWTDTNAQTAGVVKTVFFTAVNDIGESPHSPGANVTSAAIVFGSNVEIDGNLHVTGTIQEDTGT